MNTAQDWRPARWLPPEAPILLANGTRHFASCAFAITPGFRPVELDVWVPSADEAIPAVVWVHGGGYASGDRLRSLKDQRFANLLPRLLDAGIALVSIDYRLGREATFPAAIHDAKAALRWVHTYASELGVDASRVGIWGESAGAHLAAFVTATQGQVAWEGDQGEPTPTSEIRALVSWYGAMDLTSIERLKITPEIEAFFDGDVPETIRHPPEYFNLGAARWQDAELRATASPLTHVTSAMPPTLLQHGEADVIVPIQQSEVMQARMKDLRCSVELRRVPDAGHVWLNVDQDTFDDLVGQAVDFLCDCLS